MANSKVLKADKVPVSSNEPGSGKKLTKTSYTLKMMKRTWGGYVMILPFTVCFIAFTMIPVILSILLSFTDFNMLEWPSWRGFDNYIRLFLEDDLFMTAFQNTIIFAVATGPASFIISFILAWFINELSPKARSFVTFIFYAPSISGGAYLIWQLIFKEDIYGYANGWLMSLGLISEPIAFFKDVNYIVPLCIMIQLWSSLGTGFLANIAGLQGVDRSLYEAGSIDGIKNRWQEAWYITLPQMKDILLFGAVLAFAHYSSGCWLLPLRAHFLPSYLPLASAPPSLGFSWALGSQHSSLLLHHSRYHSSSTFSNKTVGTMPPGPSSSTTTVILLFADESEK